MGKRISIILLLGLFFGGNGRCFAQKVQSSSLPNKSKGVHKVIGIITDESSNAPLAGATIMIDYQKTNYISDSLGKFEMFLFSGDYHLKISHLGHEPIREYLLLRSDTLLTLTLKDKTQLLDEVIVSNTATTQSRLSPSLGISTLNIKAINKLPSVMGEVDILRSIQTLPGVSSVGEGANGLNIRGGAVEQNLVVVDDAPIFNPTHLFGLFSVFATDAIQYIELYKGGIPSRFGGRVASVLDIKTINPSETKLKVKLGIGVISNKFMAEIPLIKNKLSVFTATRFSYNDFWFKVFAPDNLKSTRANFYDVVAKIQFRPSTKDIIAITTYKNNDFYRIDSLFSLENVIAKQTSFYYGQLNFTGKWNHYINNKTSVEIVGVASRYRSQTLSLDLTNGIDLRNVISNLNFKANIDFSLYPKHKMNAGVSVLNYEILPGELNKNIVSAISTVILPKEKGLESAFYLDDEISVTTKLTMQLGLRAVNYAKLGPTLVRTYAPNEPMLSENLVSTENVNGIAQTYWSIEPRITGRYIMGPMATLKFGYNRISQFLMLISNNTTPLPTARWHLADNNILPQKGNFASVGYFQTLKRGVWEASAELYYRFTKNVLDYTSSANLQLNPTIETQVQRGVAKAYGIELMIAKKKGDTNGWLSYTYARAFQRTTEEASAQKINNGEWYRANYDRPHNVNIVLNTQMNKYNNYSFVFTLNSGRPFTSPTGSYTFYDKQYPIFIYRNNDRVPLYHRLDLAWTITNPSTKVHKWLSTWVFTVYNVYGNKNPYSIFFKKSADGLSAYQLSVFSTPLISLAYNVQLR